LGFRPVAAKGRLRRWPALRGMQRRSSRAYSTLAAVNETLPQPRPPRRFKLRFETADDHNAGLRIGPTRQQADLHVPIFSSLGQFGVNILTFGKQAQASTSQQWISTAEKLDERRQRPRGDDVDRCGAVG